MVAFSYKTKALCVRTIEQPRHVTIIQDGGAQEIWKQKHVILKFVFLHYRHSAGKKIKTNVIANIISCDLKWFFGRSGSFLKTFHQQRWRIFFRIASSPKFLRPFQPEHTYSLKRIVNSFVEISSESPVMPKFPRIYIFRQFDKVFNIITSKLPFSLLPASLVISLKLAGGNKNTGNSSRRFLAALPLRALALKMLKILLKLQRYAG